MAKKKLKPKVKNTSVKNETSTKILKKDKKPITEKKKWYNYIIEDNKKTSKTVRRQRNMISFFMIFCFISIVLSTTIIDYYTAQKMDREPYFVLKTHSEHKQLTSYYGSFYKAWKCDNGNQDIMYGTFNSESPLCEIKYTFDDSIYINPNGVKITKSQMDILKKYYFDEIITFNKKDFEEAYQISKILNEIWWVQTAPETIINKDPLIKIAIFSKAFINDLGEETYELQYFDETYHKCVKMLKNNDYIFSDYNATDHSCGEEWTELKLEKEKCELLQNGTNFVKSIVSITNVCD